MYGNPPAPESPLTHPVRVIAARDVGRVNRLRKILSRTA